MYCVLGIPLWDSPLLVLSNEWGGHGSHWQLGFEYTLLSGIWLLLVVCAYLLFVCLLTSYFLAFLCMVEGSSELWLLQE